MSTLNKSKAILGLMFFISGFSALLYQTIWLRLAFAEFGVITPVVSLIVAVFMFGLGFGSWIGGRYILLLKRLTKKSAITIYGIIEIFIGLGAFAVPKLFHLGANLYTSSGETSSWLYLLNSALVIVISILPFAIAMGMTYPTVLEFFREHISNNQDRKTFGFLYTANTLGACLGAVITVFILVEMLGFTKTLTVGVLGNFFIALIALNWGTKINSPTTELPSTISLREEVISDQNRLRGLIILFTTGFCSMGMEVIWTRSFTPVLGTLVYSFASLLSAYLFSNWLGALIYRYQLRQKKAMSQDTLILLSVLFAILPLLASIPAFFKTFLLPQPNFCIPFLCILISIMPLSATLGYLTPCIIDEQSNGDPNEAGKAYAINILGCVLGPLFIGYWILPLFGARIALILLIIPLLILTVSTWSNQNRKRIIKLAALFVSCLILLNACFWLSWEEGGLLRLQFPSASDIIIRRDYAATTTSLEKNKERILLVNGQGMTILCRATKYMAHLPLAFHQGSAKSILIICFGMGTTFRSALTWGNNKVTVVELVPGVVDAFNYYHSDAAAVRNNPNGRIVIDDGRRFLRRTKEKFDVIIVDPPPPLASAASGLLYSREFFELIKNHLNPGGILEQWFGFEKQYKIMQSMLVALKSEFPYIRMYRCVSDPNDINISGWHFLASDNPIDSLTSEEFYTRLPIKAKGDLMEPLTKDKSTYDLKQELKKFLSNEISIDTVLSSKKTIMITDDYPLNEYCLLHMLGNQEAH